MRHRWLLILVLAPLVSRSAAAGIIFGKKPSKPNPSERVPELLALVKTDGDENKRVNAVLELRQFDLASYPDIVPVLIDVLLNDKKPAVRSEAAQTLGKLRPVDPKVGQALEQAVAKDASMRVRLQARSSLLQYHWSGYRSANPGKKDDPLIQSQEPPLAPPSDKAPPVIKTTNVPPQPTEKAPAARPVPPAPKPATPPPTSGNDGPDLSPPG